MTTMCDELFSMLKGDRSLMNDFMILVNNIVDFEEEEEAIVPLGSDEKILQLYKFMDKYIHLFIKEKMFSLEYNYTYDHPWILLQMLVTFIHKLPQQYLYELFPSKEWNGKFTASNKSLIVKVLYYLGANTKTNRLRYSITPHVIWYRIVFLNHEDDGDIELLDQFLNFMKKTLKPELYSERMIKHTSFLFGRRLLGYEGYELVLPVPIDKNGEPRVEPDPQIIQKASEELGFPINIEYTEREHN
jgi:hypothetical protein